MKLAEYIYVDERRLNSYFEQLSSPIAYDKVPTWKASLSLTGPTAGGAQPPSALMGEVTIELIGLSDKVWALIISLDSTPALG